MRLWHYKLLPYLPDAQFKGQLRELVAIMHDWRDKGTTNHLLINKVFDKEDFDKIKDYCWSSCKNKKDGYVKLCSRDVKSKKLVSFHQIVFGKNVDHINRNTLDNRKENLRFANNTEQNYNKDLRKNNTSGFTGVYFDKCSNKYRARIKNKSKIYYSKACQTKEEAIQERLKLEQKFCGEFSPKREEYVI